MDLQAAIQQLAQANQENQTQSPSSADQSLTQNLNVEIDVNHADCLNQSDQHTIQHMLQNSNSNSNSENNDTSLYLESHADEQLLMFIPFVNKVNIRSIAVWAPETEQCPQTIKLYVNRSSMDFDDVDHAKPTEIIQLTSEQDGAQGKVHALKFINFRNVVSLGLFVADNHGGETTVIQKIRLVGSIITDRSSEKLQKIE